MQLNQYHPDPFALASVYSILSDHGFNYQENIQLDFVVFTVFKQSVDKSDNFSGTELLSAYADTLFELIGHKLGSRYGLFKDSLDNSFSKRVKTFFQFEHQLIQTYQRNLHHA